MLPAFNLKQNGRCLRLRQIEVFRWLAHHQGVRLSTRCFFIVEERRLVAKYFLEHFDWLGAILKIAVIKPRFTRGQSVGFGLIVTESIVWLVDIFTEQAILLIAVFKHFFELGTSILCELFRLHAAGGPISVVNHVVGLAELRKRNVTLLVLDVISVEAALTPVFSRVICCRSPATFHWVLPSYGLRLSVFCRLCKCVNYGGELRCLGAHGHGSWSVACWQRNIALLHLSREHLYYSPWLALKWLLIPLVLVRRSGLGRTWRHKSVSFLLRLRRHGLSRRVNTVLSVISHVKLFVIYICPEESPIAVALCKVIVDRDAHWLRGTFGWFVCSVCLSCWLLLFGWSTRDGPVLGVDATMHKQRSLPLLLLKVLACVYLP